MIEDLLNTDTIVDVSVSSSGKVVESTDKIALVDADTVAYAVCVTTETEVAIFPKEFYTKEEWSEIITNHNYTEDSEVLYSIDLELAIQKVENRLQDILDATGCKDYELHFTVGKHSFRHIIYPEYKSNRKGTRAPEGITDIKYALRDKYPDKVFIHENIEADDAVCTLYDSSLHTLCAVDKDVLYSVAGKHWNYYSSAKYSIDPKWIEVDELTAMKNCYKQTLTGDATDNIAGLLGIGAKTADKLLTNCTTQQQCWDAVIRKYKDTGKTEDDAILAMRLVNMYQAVKVADGFEVVLWEPSIIKESNK